MATTKTFKPKTKVKYTKRTGETRDGVIKEIDETGSKGAWYHVVDTETKAVAKVRQANLAFA